MVREHRQMTKIAETIADDAGPELLDEPDADAQYSEAIDLARAAKRGKVRVRILVQLYAFGEKQRYRNWRGVVWRLDLDQTVLAGSNFRAALSTFFQAVGTVGPARVVDALKNAMEG